MSEYQYFEFQAIDRPLSKKEMAELRSYSTRARITPTSFVNDYTWGDFKGDADAWMDKYFDAFLYVANWGTHILKLRLPDNQLSTKTARLYAVDERAAERVKNGNVIFSFHSEDEDDEDSVESEGLLASMISVRSELAHGDLRALYLGWLLCAQSGELDPADLSPPVPPGLMKLSASLTSVAEFLRVDRTLVRIAAKPTTKRRSFVVGPAGFGAEVRQAMRQQLAFLLEQGLAERQDDQVTLKPNLLATLRSRELAAVGKSIEADTHLTYRETRDGESIRGVYRRSIDLASGRFAMLDDGIGFSLVPWRPVMEEHLGRELRGISVGSNVSWDFSRSRGLGR